MLDRWPSTFCGPITNSEQPKLTPGKIERTLDFFRRHAEEG